MRLVGVSVSVFGSLLFVGVAILSRFVVFCEFLCHPLQFVEILSHVLVVCCRGVLVLLDTFFLTGVSVSSWVLRVVFGVLLGGFLLGVWVYSRAFGRLRLVTEVLQPNSSRER